MAKHCKPRKRRNFAAARTGRAAFELSAGRNAAKYCKSRRRGLSLVLLGTTAAGLSTVLVFGHATNNAADALQVDLAVATIGIGGRGDPTAANIPNKLSGNVVPGGFTYIPVLYPAGFDIDNSVAAGVPVLDQTIGANSDEDLLLVVGYSEGAIVAEKVRRDLDPSDPDAPSTADALFVMIASPNVPNGGIFGRFPNLTIPFFVTSNGPAEPSPYDTTYVTNEYDPYADFPAYFNPFSLANTIVAVVYVHPDQYYDSVDYDPLTGDGTTLVIVKEVTNSEGGNDTYVFVPAAQLPLLAPVRQVATATGTTILTEPLLSAVEPVLRLLIDMGYTDRENLNPEDHVQFSLITPPGRIVQTVSAMPAAITEGANNLIGGVTTVPASIPAPVDPASGPNTSSINAASVPQRRQVEPVVDDAAKSADESTPALPSASTTPGPTSATRSGATTSLTEPSPVINDGPTLGKVTNDGNKVTPNGPSSTTAPNRKTLLTEVNSAITGPFGGNKTPPAPASSRSPADGPSNASSPSGSASASAAS